MTAFKTIYQDAIKQKGSKEAIQDILPEIQTTQTLSKQTDDRYLSLMAKGIFCAGFVWRVVEQKWPHFEKAFRNFDINTVSQFGIADIDALTQDASIIRNHQKIVSVYENAKFIQTIQEQHGTFAHFIAQWPTNNIIGLWDNLKKQGKRLGGMTGPYFLRRAGKDTFLLTHDVTQTLIRYQVLTKAATSKKDLQHVQNTFNQWHQETGLPYAHLSRILACF